MKSVQLLWVITSILVHIALWWRMSWLDMIQQLAQVL